MTDVDVKTLLIPVEVDGEAMIFGGMVLCGVEECGDSLNTTGVDGKTSVIVTAGIEAGVRGVGEGDSANTTWVDGNISVEIEVLVY